MNEDKMVCENCGKDDFTSKEEFEQHKMSHMQESGGQGQDMGGQDQGQGMGGQGNMPPEQGGDMGGMAGGDMGQSQGDDEESGRM